MQVIFKGKIKQPLTNKFFTSHKKNSIEQINIFLFLIISILFLFTKNKIKGKINVIAMVVFSEVKNIIKIKISKYVFELIALKLVIFKSEIINIKK